MTLQAEDNLQSVRVVRGRGELPGARPTPSLSEEPFAARCGQPVAEAPAPCTGGLLPAPKPPPRLPRLSPALRPLSPCGSGCCSACCCCRRRCRTVSRRDPLRAAIGGPLPASPASRSAAPARHVGGWRPSRGEGAPVLRGGVGRAASRWLPANRCLWQGMRFVRGRELGWRWREASLRTAAAPPLSAPPLPLRPSQTRRSKPVLESLPPVLRRVGAALGARFHNNNNVT